MHRLHRYKVEKYMQWVFIVASATMAVPVMFHLDSTAEDNTREGQRTCCPVRDMHSVTDARTQRSVGKASCSWLPFASLRCRSACFGRR